MGLIWGTRGTQGVSGGSNRQPGLNARMVDACCGTCGEVRGAGARVGRALMHKHWRPACSSVKGSAGWPLRYLYGSVCARLTKGVPPGMGEVGMAHQCLSPDSLTFTQGIAGIGCYTNTGLFMIFGTTHIWLECDWNITNRAMMLCETASTCSSWDR